MFNRFWKRTLGFAALMLICASAAPVRAVEEYRPSAQQIKEEFEKKRKFTYGGPLTVYCNKWQEQLRATWKTEGDYSKTPNMTMTLDKTGKVVSVAPANDQNAQLLLNQKRVKPSKALLEEVNSNTIVLNITPNKSVNELEVIFDDIQWADYMATLQKMIKRCWYPPKGQESRHSVVQFLVHSDGSISDLKLSTSSQVPLMDQQSLKAVQDATPFAPLPDGAAEKITIQFTLDYNVHQRGK